MAQLPQGASAEDTVPAGPSLPVGAGGAPQRSSTPPRSGPAPIRLLRVCLDNRVLGGVEVSETSTLADVRESIDEDEIQGVPESFLFLFSGAPVTRRQEARRRALVCFPFGFLTIIPENAHIEANLDAAGVSPTSVASPASLVGGTASSSISPATGAGDPTPHAGGRESPSFGGDAGVVEPELGGNDADVGAGGGGPTLELHITDGPLEGTTLMIGQDGARVGRHTSNTLVIPEAGISRFHCEIQYVDGCFNIRDLGSVTGTFYFLKPHGQFRMFVGLMMKLGETEFQVLSQTQTGNGACEQAVLFFEGPFAGHKIAIPASGITIGRRQDNNLVITPDGTVSAHHAVIFSQDGEFYISDLGSCNGTCVRLGAERTESDWHPIMDGDVIGAGCTKILCRVREAVAQ